MSDSPPLSIPAGETRVFAIAGLNARFKNELDDERRFFLPSSYAPFLTTSVDSDIDIRVGCCQELPAARGSLLYDSQLHWRALADQDAILFELIHPPTLRLYCRMSVRPDFTDAEVLFSERAYRQFAPGATREWDLPYPLDQLLLVPALALRGVVLLHASGAVLSTGALVFAGHSGDGKTTLSGILSSEGVPLLSDERVALRQTDSGFVAHGTPWPGEGRIVSNASGPLRALFVLRKAKSHSIGEASVGSLVPEIIARAIVPYYLPDIVARILDSFAELSTRVPIRELRFARKPGLKSLLQVA